MRLIPGYPRLLHGGDYNPDQWRRHPEVLDEDFRLMEQAGCNTFSVGIFSWSQYEPEEGRWEWGWMDDIFERAHRAGFRLFLATPTGARPAWLGQNHPETNRTDYHGVRARWEGRHNHCWTSPVMREKTRIIDTLLAERYGRHPALAGWHISNEYGGHCHCELCRAGFVKWLERRYGDIEALNAAYWTEFWGHRLTRFEQVESRDWSGDSCKVDWMRYMTECLVDFFKWEAACIRPHSSAPVTTNMMGIHPEIDYWRLAGHCDLIADDCYPSWLPGQTARVAAHYAMLHDLHYTMKGRPWLLMESCPGVPNYMPYPRMRRPGELEREALLALGHGADGIMYFQWRKGLGGAEKFHGAVVGPCGTAGTRVFQSVADLGARLARVAETAGSRMEQPRAAVVFDWESNWCLAQSSGFGQTSQLRDGLAIGHYAALFNHNIPAAVVDGDGDFSPYSLLAMPLVFMMKDGMAERLESYVRAGGTLLMTYLSAYVDKNNQCFRGGFPGGPPLRKLMGIWNEDIDGMAPGDRQSIRLTGIQLAAGDSFPVARMAECIHAEGAEVMAVFTDGVLAGLPALTCHRVGRGEAWYLAGEAEQDFLDALYGFLAARAGCRPALPDMPPEARVSRRYHDQAEYFYLINLSDREVSVPLPRAMEDIWRGEWAAWRATLPPNGGTLLKAAERP